MRVVDVAAIDAEIDAAACGNSHPTKIFRWMHERTISISPCQVVMSMKDQGESTIKKRGKNFVAVRGVGNLRAAPQHIALEPSPLKRVEMVVEARDPYRVGKTLL